MNCKYSMAIIGVFLFSVVASANFGPPYLPKDKKIVEPPVQFDGTKKHADHVFYLYYSATYFGYKIVEVKESEPIKIRFEAKDRVPVAYLELLAVERNDFEKRKKADPSLKWLSEKKEGVLTTKLPAPATTAPLNAKDPPVTTFRVSLKDGKLSAEKLEVQKTGAAETSPPWGFGVVMSLSMTWLGLWFARRGRREA